MIAATNCPEQLDAALLRRFSRLVHVPLPDAKARHAMLRRALHNTRHALNEDDIERLVQQTELNFIRTKIINVFK